MSTITNITHQRQPVHSASLTSLIRVTNTQKSGIINLHEFPKYVSCFLV